MTVAGPFLLTCKSACVCTVVLAVELLLPLTTSVVVVLTDAVLLSVALLATLALTVAVMVMVCVAPAASVVMVSLTALPVCFSANCGPVPGWPFDLHVALPI